MARPVVVDYRLVRLRQAVQALAQPAAVQRGLVPEGVEAARDLEHTYGHWYSLIMAYHRATLTERQWQALIELHSQLSRLHGRANAHLWTDDALHAAPQWAVTRQHAAAVLIAFGWPADVPPPGDQRALPSGMAGASRAGAQLTAVPLPPELQVATRRAHETMAADANHDLRPSDRATIYRAFGPLANVVSRRARTWLAIWAAWRVLPLWQRERLGDSLPERMLALAEQVLARRVHRVLARDEVGLAWSQLEQYGARNTLSTAAFWAGEAAVTTALTAFGERNDVEGLLTRGAEAVTDRGLDIWTGDAALWAMQAWASQPDGRLDTSRQQEFWTWWLSEAVPMAWASAAAR